MRSTRRSAHPNRKLRRNRTRSDFGTSVPRSRASRATVSSAGAVVAFAETTSTGRKAAPVAGGATMRSRHQRTRRADSPLCRATGRAAPPRRPRSPDLPPFVAPSAYLRGAPATAGARCPGAVHRALTAHLVDEAEECQLLVGGGVEPGGDEAAGDDQGGRGRRGSGRGWRRRGSWRRSRTWGGNGEVGSCGGLARQSRRRRRVIQAAEW